ncbi:ketoacyl-ACP synthase III family protein [Streptomyces sp. NPDC005355]|uniref:ketoacyl-ACP synthase III family protein n=1 Tax=Streptomyces sp. NPDC005355 TaxID=3157038 RepID=UPI0033BB8EE8
MSDGLYIAAASSWLPERLTLDEAEQAGLADRAGVWNTGIESVCVSPDKSAPEMAVLAARDALVRAEVGPEDLQLLLHACAYHQGHDMWPAASYVQRFCGGGSYPAVEVRQMSNGGMIALELAAGHLRAYGGSTALVTTADRFSLPGFDRWRSDPSTICGDGGTAVVVSTRTGFARLRGLVTVSDPGLEHGSRGERFSDAPLAARAPIDLNSDSLVRELGVEALLNRIEAGQREAFDRACAQADFKLGDIDWYVLPNLGRTRMRAQYFDPFGIDPQRSTWSWGRRVGHLGAGDQFAGLAHLVSEGALEPGQMCLLAGVGAGFTWTAGILEIIARP